MPALLNSLLFWAGGIIVAAITICVVVDVLRPRKNRGKQHGFPMDEPPKPPLHK